MSKKTINSILTGFIIVLVVAIVILTIKIAVRKPVTEVEEGTAVQTAISENIAAAESAAVSENEVEEEEEVLPAVLVVFPDTTSNINVRSGPGVDYERVGAAYANTSYEVVQVLENGWTKVIYEGYEAYMSSELLIFQMQTEIGDGTYTYALPTEKDIPYEPGASSVLIK
ncbi:MAG: SH3 domain-containing protein [Lachnospiraceae bacterium]|nr:SH3 domain-containing protein [Lachnospiraceae bacterium]